MVLLLLAVILVYVFYFLIICVLVKEPITTTLDDLIPSHYFYTGRSSLRELLNKDEYSIYKNEFVQVGNKVYRINHRPVNGFVNGVYIKEGSMITLATQGNQYMTEVGSSRLIRDIEGLARVCLFHFVDL
jgi:hypothetical protein